MNYGFPIIKNINDVLPYVEDRDDIVVVDKGFYTVVNYVKITSDTFRPVNLGETIEERHKRAIIRECRGLIFDNVTSEIISRPFHKFKNVNEDEETLFDKIDLSKPHIILDKLDGSMIRPFETSDGMFRVGTKMGETEIAAQAVRFFAERGGYMDLALSLIHAGFTPIFEFMSPDNRIVIDYGPEDRLVLTAIRDNISGIYQDYHILQRLGQECNVPIVGFHEIDVTNSEHLIRTVRGMTDIEGFVVKFRDGHMVKIKTEQYVAIHKAKDNLLYERLVADMVLNEKVDDVLPYLVETDKQRLISYQDNFIHKFSIFCLNFVSRSWTYVAVFGNSRKDFALNHSAEFGPLSSIIFRNFDYLSDHDKRDLDDWRTRAEKEIKEFFLKKTNSNTGWEEFKKAIDFDIVW